MFVSAVFSPYSYVILYKIRYGVLYIAAGEWGENIVGAKNESKKGGVTLICPSSINFTAVFLSFLYKGMETSVYSLKKLEKWRKNTKKKTTFAHLKKKKKEQRKKDDSALPIWLQ